MEKTTTTTTTGVKTRRKTETLKKVSADYLKVSDKPVGFSFEGIFVGINTTEHVTDEGEVQTRYNLIIENEKGERTKLLADAGLRTALADAMVVKGDWFKAVKCEKVPIQGKRTMNTWDIYQSVETEN